MLKPYIKLKYFTFFERHATNKGSPQFYASFINLHCNKITYKNMCSIHYLYLQKGGIFSQVLRNLNKFEEPLQLLNLKFYFHFVILLRI